MCSARCRTVNDDTPGTSGGPGVTGVSDVSRKRLKTSGGLVGASADEAPNALEGDGTLVTRPQPFRFKLEDAYVRASQIERGKHDSQLQYLSVEHSLIRGYFSPDGFNTKAS